MDSVVRVGLIFIFIIACLRMLGKKELSEVSPYELVMLMLIPEIASQALSRDDRSMTHAFIGIATLMSLVFINSVVSYHFKPVKKVVEGEPTILFREGKFYNENMDRERVDADEIMSEMRRAGFETFRQLRWVILEPDGKLAFIPISSGQLPVTTEENRI